MPINVLHILGSLSIGGAENLVLDLIQGGATLEDNTLGNNSVEYSVVYMHQSAPERVELFKRGLNNRLTLIECAKGSLATLSFISKLKKYLSHNKIDVIHCHNNVDAYWAHFASRGTGVKKIILTVHGMNLNFNFLNHKLGKGMLAKLSGGNLNPDKSLLRSFKITYVSGVTKEFYKEKYGWKELGGDVVYNGVEWRKFWKDNVMDYKCVCSKNPQNTKIDYGSFIKGLTPENIEHLNNSPVFGMIGNFNTPVRLQKMICEALVLIKNGLEGGDIISRRTQPLAFVFIGGRDEQNPTLFDECVEICKMEGLLNKEVFFLGRQSNIPAILNTLSGYVYGSSADAFGLSVIEAVMSGLPVICSDIPTFREVTLNGELAQLIPNTAQHFAQAMVELQKKLSGNKNMYPDRVLNFNKAKECYSIEKCRENYEALYIV